MDIKYFSRDVDMTKKLIEEYEYARKAYRSENQTCLVQQFFDNEEKAGRSPSACMISCPCPRCSPMSM